MVLDKRSLERSGSLYSTLSSVYLPHSPCVLHRAEARIVSGCVISRAEIKHCAHDLPLSENKESTLLPKANMLRYNAAVVPQQGNLWNAQHQNPNVGQSADTAQQLERRARVEAAQLRVRYLQAEAANLFSRPITPNEPTTCVICDEEYPITDLCSLLCNHWHCKSCLMRNARVALKSNPFIPAKCCGVIPTELLRQSGTLTANEVEQYKVKMEELTNPRSKLYCWGCAAYIPNDRRTKRIGDCSICGKRTCKTCRAKSHFGACDKTKIQADGEAEDDIYLLAESKGWKRCPNCLNLIQKNGGCNHMTCNCGENFCYLCGEVYGIYGVSSHLCERQQLQDQQQRQLHQRRQHQRQLQLQQQQHHQQQQHQQQQHQQQQHQQQQHQQQQHQQQQQS
ncbi:hypothetical protein F4782DRAFT_500855 [Xylaria castorea]|nr:hypothetical protein F4782DRAFT_500855 [Xylaria castorea]